MDDLVGRLKCGIHFRAGVIPSNPEPNTAYGEPDLVDAARVMAEAAARIQALETSLAGARRQALEEAAKACEDERLCEPQDESDAAYDSAIDHCAQAIRALADPLLDRQGDGKVQS